MRLGVGRGLVGCTGGDGSRLLCGDAGGLSRMLAKALQTSQSNTSTKFEAFEVNVRTVQHNHALMSTF
jgi:hypothetical protein